MPGFPDIADFGCLERTTAIRIASRAVVDALAVPPSRNRLMPMRFRAQLFEFEDLPWFPTVIRAGMMDYLRFMISNLDIYEPVVPLLHNALQQTDQQRIIELGAGAGGGTEEVVKDLRRLPGMAKVRVTLTDLYPQPAAWQDIRHRTWGIIGYEPTPVNALAVPESLTGFRTIFSAFHHFEPAAAEAMLSDAVRKRAGFGAFEGAGKHWHEILLAWTVLPVLQLLATPFMKPFRLSRLFFTYIIPLIPLCTIWDGTVSILRMYSPDQLLALARRADPEQTFQWQTGKVRHWTGSQVTYLVGWPK
ncbi:class I SAM-dependent methyltransferase [Hymenobacter sp. BT491]|uniref:class I SAM-dependent methyltransferase n=1 Tax=Hymenobacter sp. BT491 TaxID=2766779 RepID=UPI0016535734|nr:class I SAM-dependent methyltransferase [Hymenobacter sp. BT491]MBC6990633.1 class I SAM-dependent methyltransferase [Hymenobacter sp. BT491]